MMWLYHRQVMMTEYHTVGESFCPQHSVHFPDRALVISRCLMYVQYYEHRCVQMVIH